MTTAGKRPDWGPLLSIPWHSVWHRGPAMLSFPPHSTQLWQQQGCAEAPLPCSRVPAQFPTKQGWGARHRPLQIHSTKANCSDKPLVPDGMNQSAVGTGQSHSGVALHHLWKAIVNHGRSQLLGRQQSVLSCKRARAHQRLFLTQITLSFQLQSSHFGFVF